MSSRRTRSQAKLASENSEDDSGNKSNLCVTPKKVSPAKKKAKPAVAKKITPKTQRASSKRNVPTNSKSQDAQEETQPDTLPSENVVSDEHPEIATSNKGTKSTPTKQVYEAENMRHKNTDISLNTSETIKGKSLNDYNDSENSEIESALLMVNDFISQSDEVDSESVAIEDGMSIKESKPVESVSAEVKGDDNVDTAVDSESVPIGDETSIKESKPVESVSAEMKADDNVDTAVDSESVPIGDETNIKGSKPVESVSAEMKGDGNVDTVVDSESVPIGDETNIKGSKPVESVSAEMKGDDNVDTAVDSESVPIGDETNIKGSKPVESVSGAMKGDENLVTTSAAYTAVEESATSSSNNTPGKVGCDSEVLSRPVEIQSKPSKNSESKDFQSQKESSQTEEENEVKQMEKINTGTRPSPKQPHIPDSAYQMTTGLSDTLIKEEQLKDSFKFKEETRDVSLEGISTVCVKEEQLKDSFEFKEETKDVSLEGSSTVGVKEEQLKDSFEFKEETKDVSLEGSSTVGVKNVQTVEKSDDITAYQEEKCSASEEQLLGSLDKQNAIVDDALAKNQESISEVVEENNVTPMEIDPSSAQTDRKENVDHLPDTQGDEEKTYDSSSKEKELPVLLKEEPTQDNKYPPWMAKPPTKPTPKTPADAKKLEAEKFKATYTINHLPLHVRFYVMREGVNCKKRIKEFSGASVVLKGKYIAPEVNFLTEKVEEPLHFLIQGKTQQCVDAGIQMIEVLIREALEEEAKKEEIATKAKLALEALKLEALKAAEKKAKDSLLNKNKSTQQNKETPWNERLPTPPGFETPVVTKMEQNDAHLADQFQTEYKLNNLALPIRNYIVEEGVTKKSIEEFSGSSVELRGVLAGQIPLHLYIKGPSQKAVEMAIQLVDTLKQEAVEEEERKRIQSGTGEEDMELDESESDDEMITSLPPGEEPVIFTQLHKKSVTPSTANKTTSEDTSSIISVDSTSEDTQSVISVESTIEETPSNISMELTRNESFKTSESDKNNEDVASDISKQTASKQYSVVPSKYGNAIVRVSRKRVCGTFKFIRLPTALKEYALKITHLLTDIKKISGSKTSFSFYVPHNEKSQVHATIESSSHLRIENAVRDIESLMNKEAKARKVSADVRLVPLDVNEDDVDEKKVVPSPRDKFGGDYVINYLPHQVRNYIVAHGVVTHGITDNSGAKVFMKGKYIPPDQTPGTPSVDAPLYLHFQGPTPKSIELAIQFTKKLIRDGTKEHIPYSEKIFVGLDHAVPAFNVVNKVLNGENGPNLVYIANETGATVTLRGMGTSFVESDGKVSSEPLHIKIDHKRSEGLKKAVELTRSLVKTVADEYQEFLQNGSTGPPSVVTQFPQKRPPGTLLQEKIFVALTQTVPAFNVVDKVLKGVAGPNLDFIANETGATVTLRGVGTSFLEPNGKVSPEPLHIKIEHTQWEGLKKAVDLAKSLVKTVIDEYIAFTQHNLPAPAPDTQAVIAAPPMMFAPPMVMAPPLLMRPTRLIPPPLLVPPPFRPVPAPPPPVIRPMLAPATAMTTETTRLTLKRKPDESDDKIGQDIKKMKPYPVKGSNKPQKIQFKIGAGSSKTTQEKIDVQRVTKLAPVSINEEELTKSVKQAANISTGKANTTSISKLEIVLELLRKAVQIYCRTVTEEKVKDQLHHVLKLIQVMFTDVTLSKLKNKQSSDISSDMQKKVVLLVQYLDKLFESQTSYQVSQFLPIMKLLKEAVAYDSLNKSSTSKEEKKELSKTEISDKFTNAENKSLPLGDVLQQVTKELVSFIGTLPRGYHKRQLGNILDMLKAGEPTNIKKVSQQQKSNLRSIQYLLIKKLKDPAYPAPRRLIENVELMKTALSAKSTQASEVKSVEVIENLTKPSAASGSLANESKKVSSAPKTTHTSREKHVEKLETVSQPTAGPSSSTNQWQGHKHVFELDGKLKQPPQVTDRVETVTANSTQQVLSTGTVLQKHAKVLQTIQLLETSLESHANAMSLGQSKIQLLQITQNLHQVLKMHEGSMVSVQDQKQLMLIMQLLETLFQSQNLQTSTGHPPTIVVKIVQEVQQLLDNLASVELVQEPLPQVKQAVVPTQRRFEMEAPSVAAKQGQPSSRTPAQPAPPSFGTAKVHSEQIPDPQTVELTHIKQMLQKGLESLSSLRAPDTQSGNPELNQLLQQMQQVTQLLESKQQTIPDQRSESIRPTAVSGSSQKVNESMERYDRTKLQQEDIKLEQSSLVVGGEEKNVILVKPDKKSLYASLAYLLQGPFETHEELFPMAEKFQKETVNFIRSNKDLFFIFVNRVYREVFPNDTLDHEMVFEKYCLFLAQSENLIVQVPLRAIATVFKTPIAVLTRNGQRNVVEPFFPVKKSPVEIINCDALNFCPLIEPELTFATWHVTSTRNWDVPAKKFKEIDLCLNKHNVVVACVQGSEAPTTFGGMSTPNYIWWCTKSREVAFLIQKDSGVKLKNFVTSDGFVSAEINWKKHFYSLFGCNFSDSQNNNHFTKCLSEILSQNTSNVQIIVLGDFNALVGSSSVVKNDEMNLIGKNLYHRSSNSFGMILQDLAVKYNFRIVTSFPNENNLPSVTLKNKNGMFQVSHILMEQRPNQLVKNYLHWEEGFNQAIVACNISYLKPTSLDELKTKNDVDTITFLTWNTGDCSLPESQEAIDTVLFDKAVDLACIQGTNLVQGTLRTTHYNWWCCGSSRSPNNVALLLRRNSGATLSDFEARSSSVASAVLTVGECRYAVVGCYLPHNFSSTYNDVACDIMLSLNTAPLSARLLLLGDFTAVLGLEDLTTSEELHLAKKGLLKTTSNANGVFLKRLALLHDLFICSTNKKVEQQDNFNNHTSHILLLKGNSFHVEGCLRTYTLNPLKPCLISFSIPRDTYYLE